MRSIDLELGWPRAVAQGINYSCDEIELGITFQRNLTNLGVTLNWGLDGCARLRKVTVTATVTIE